MLKVRNLGLLLALSSVAALPACSWFGGGNGGSQSSSAAAPSPNYASAQQPNYSSSAAPQQAEVQQPVTPDTIRQVQQMLKQQGMYRGRVDGVLGPQTQAAVRSYRQSNNLTLASLTQGNGQSYNNQQQPSQQNAQTNQQGGSVTR